MPKGGQLQIATRNIMVTNRERARHPEAEPGAYAAITVRDTGQGIPADIAARIFEPFFSTKGPEKGTGLGLPMVFGFVQQSGGHLSVRSADGAGASFRLYLPRTDAGTVAAASGGATGTVPGGSESILVVEDNPAMRRAVVRQLGVLGYRVREAEHAEAAMEALRDRGAPNLLLTDLVLQGQGDGLDLAIAARQSWPGLKVLLMSGFPGVRDASRRLEECGLPMLDKPFFLDELAAAVRQALSADAVPGPAPFPPGRPESAARRTDCV
jgi:CheY-like chemotaxis protein